MSATQFQHIIKQEIDSLLGFLQPFLGLANSHMVDFFTNNIYSNSLPINIQTDIKEAGQDNVINLIFKNDFDGVPSLKQFVENTNKFTLKNSNICLSADSFIQKLQNLGCDNFEKFKLEIFMTAKKAHEVEILSAATASISKVSNTTHLVDLGDGKGYLSSMLALHHSIPVLGIDASNANTCGALKRADKLSKVWNGIPNAPKKSHPAKNDNTSNPNVDLYKQLTKFVDENFDLQQLVVDLYELNAAPRLGLVGLHTCGNLASTSLKIFCKNECVNTVCNVGCCYHLLTERFEKGSDDDFGFPLSQYLTDKKVVIGRNARMIANHSVDRVLCTKELPNITIYYRALLQVLFERYCKVLPTKHVGKFRKQPESFVEYCRVAMKRTNAELDISDEEIESLHLLYMDRVKELNVFYLLRCKLSPVTESLILLDRLLFLHEKGFENSFLVHFFNSVVSPRGYGIVAIKQLQK